MKRRMRLGIVVGLALVALVTVPYLISGAKIRTAIEDLPATAGSLGIPILLDELVYQRGLYRSSFSARVRLPGIENIDTLNLEGRVVHRAFGTRIVTSVGNGDWEQQLFGHRAVASKGQLKLITDITINPLHANKWEHHSVIWAPELLIPLQRPPETNFTLSPVTLDIQSNAERAAVTVKIEKLAGSNPTLGTIDLSAARIRIDGGLSNGMLNLSAPAQSSIAASLDSLSVRAGPLALRLTSSTIEGQFDARGDSLSINGQFSAEKFESIGVPYIRLQKLISEVKATIHLTRSEIDDPHTQISPVLNVHHSLTSESNYGDIGLHLTADSLILPISKRQQSETVVTASVDTPASLVHLLSQRFPQVASC